MLDEPASSLDPLARREFLAGLMEAVADQDLTVVLSSHLLGDVERVCDHLVLLDRGRVRLAGDVDELLAAHHLLTGPRRDPRRLPTSQRVVQASHTERQTNAAGAHRGGRSATRPGPSPPSGWKTWCSPTWRPSPRRSRRDLASPGGSSAPRPWWPRSGLVAALAVLAVTGGRLAHDYTALGLADCAAGREIDVGTLTCGDLERQVHELLPGGPAARAGSSWSCPR